MMVKKVFIFIGLFLGCMGSLQAKVGLKEKSKTEKIANKSPAIKVLIAKDIPGAMLEIQGRYNIEDPYLKKRMATRFLGKRRYVEPVPEGLKWGEVFPGTYQLCFIPDKKDTVTVFNGVQYLGSMYVYQIDGILNVVNEVPIEEFVSSILTKRIDENYSNEALVALVIAARTDACYKSKYSKNPYFDVVADEAGYQGHVISRRGDPVQIAIQTTKHLVLSRTRSYQGDLQPLLTRCLAKESDYRTTWNIKRAEELACQGKNASGILVSFFPEASIELMDSVEKVSPMAAENSPLAEVPGKPTP